MQRGDDEWERRFVLIVSPAIIFVCRFTAATTTPLHAAMQDISRQPSSAKQPVLSACKPVRIITMKAVERWAMRGGRDYHSYSKPFFEQCK